MPHGKQLPSSTALTGAEPTDASASARHDGPVSHVVSSLCEVSPSASGTVESYSKPDSGSLQPKGEPQCAQASLRDEVREALRGVLHDSQASAAAKASAGRTLLEYFDGGEGSIGGGKRATELSIVELDAEIARLTRG